MTEFFKMLTESFETLICNPGAPIINFREDRDKFLLLHKVQTDGLQRSEAVKEALGKVLQAFFCDSWASVVKFMTLY